MLRIDDPLLSLILRFVLSSDELKQPDEEFIQRQIRTLKNYIAQFPEADQEKNALVWIEQHSENYRRSWEKSTVSVSASKVQCVDCPMVLKGGASHCVIHQEWLRLLAGYRNDSISTKSYIERTLALLQEHKDQLKLTVQQTRQSNSRH